MVYRKSRKARELFTSASKIDMIDLATSPEIVFLTVDHDPFAGPEIIRIAPSTESQKEIWASCMIGRDDANRAYNESITLHFKGSLHKSAFERALETLIERNDSLRTAFSADGKQLCVFNKQPLDFYYKDLSEILDPVAEQIVQKYIKDDALFVFSLTDGPLLKTGLFKINSNEYKFVLTTHHIICDGWSIGILLQELSKLYSSYSLHLPIQLPAAPLFSKYAFEHQKFICSGDYQTQEEFWLKNLNHNTPIVNLPTDFDRPLVRTYKSGRLDYSLDQKLISQLKKIGVENGCSLVITLTAAFELFLQRLTGQEDLILGLPAADQSASGNLRLIGHCVNLLPLRSKPRPGHTFSEFLKERRAFMFDAYENQQITFGSLLKKLTISRNTSRVPLIPVVFNIDMGLTDGVNFSGLDFKFFNNSREYESFELFVNATGSEESFILEWSYNTQLFKPESVNRMMAGFTRILKTLVANSNVLLHDVLLTDKNELLAAVHQRNETDVIYPQTKCLIQLIEETAAANADKIALVHADDEIRFAELNQKANQLARFLLEKEIKVGDVIGLAVERSPEMIVALLAILKTGATFVPLDAELPRERINFMLSDVSANITITSKKHQDKFSSQAIEVIIEDALSESKNQLITNPDVRISTTDIAYIIYTSGSTGKPKGVLIEQGSILNYIQSSINAYSSPEQRYAGSFIHLALSFDASLTAVFVPLIIGKSIVISSKPALEVFDDENIIKFAPFDFIKLTPAQLLLLKNSKNAKALFAARKLVLGGEALLKRHIDFLIELQADVEIINEYGPTEASVGCVSYAFNIQDDFKYSSSGISIGKPMPNVRIYILDKFLNPVPDDTEGEIYIGGVQVAKGYLNRPELNTEKFISNPFNQSETLYRTGDLAKYAEDGSINYLGRIDDQFKIRGYRIEPGEIEQLLIKQENIKQALVIAREDRTGDQRLVAYIVSDKLLLDEEFQIQIQIWKHALKNQLPVYMCPADYVSITSIPLTVNGKVDKAKLPKPGFDKISARFTAPETEMEKLVASNWTQFLGVKNISIHDDFFELGGHSLLAIEALAQLAKQAGKILPVSALLENSTIYKLACLLDNGIAVDRWKSLVAIKTSGTKNPLYIIHGAGLGVWAFTDLISHLHEEQPAYAFQGLGIDGLDEPFETVEETVAFYISELLQQNPTGPYLLAGFSDGGLIAFEMARQLKSLGKQVAMLGLFDTYIQEPVFRSTVEKIILKLKQATHKVRCLFLHPRKALESQRQLLKIRLLNIAGRTFGYKHKDDFRETYPHLYEAMHKYAISLSKYRRQSYDGVIDLFRAKVRVYYVDDFETLGWEPYTTEDIIIHKVPGDHDDMILAEKAPAFAKVLQKAIDEKSPKVAV